MNVSLTLWILFVSCFSFFPSLPEKPEMDVLSTSQGPLEIYFIGHGTLMFRWNGVVVHVDPYSRVAEYSELPDADLVMITHDHGDHLDPDALKEIVTSSTVIFCNEASGGSLEKARVMHKGDQQDGPGGIGIEAIPAYNIKHKRSNGDPYHPKGNGNGYVLTFGEVRVYVAGDTEDIPEMAGLEDIKVAFLPMNMPYTMNPAQVASAARMFRPEILYPYHYGKTDPNELVRLLEGDPIEVRIRNLQ
jgi:L-ascorbate metabolism protein UlaG (beta-lactamase superfamily)